MNFSWVTTDNTANHLTLSLNKLHTAIELFYPPSEYGPSKYLLLFNVLRNYGSFHAINKKYLYSAVYNLTAIVTEIRNLEQLVQDLRILCFRIGKVKPWRPIGL
jgi:hypothetical protein